MLKGSRYGCVGEWGGEADKYGCYPHQRGEIKIKKAWYMDWP